MKEQVFDNLKRAQNILLGKDEAFKLALTCFISNGHLLLEDVPGVGKTTLVQLMAQVLGLPLSRIQFTNDLLPSDILGINIFDRQTGEFRFSPGPLFGNFILADELNRASPKTQSALLQAMEEREISLDGQTHQLGFPFLVVATQNPAHQIGTFPLPESQLDRFFLSLSLGFPTREDERRILLLEDIKAAIDSIPKGPGAETLMEMQQAVAAVHVSQEVLDYILDLLEYGRLNLEHGKTLSPRAGQDVVSAARGYAYLSQRDFITSDDVQRVLTAVWAHRLGGFRGREFGVKDVEQILTHVHVD
jgi:MoxR-like ATPase